MSKSRSFFLILIPGITVFISSGCIMMLELVAGRIMARHLGSSLYTWTSVIGIVLAGITIGNYLGGRIADRLPARKALSLLLGISSVSCVTVIVLNNLVIDWLWLWKLNWPVHIFMHVLLVFMLPSVLLGMISPVVAKTALDKGLPTGRTVGDIYAFSAAGSILGTFLAGFYLIDAIGTIAIIWAVAGVLLLIAILHCARLWALYIWAVIFIALMTMGTTPAKWAESIGLTLALRKQKDPSILYETESQYCYIAVQQLSQNQDSREFIQDKLTHSKIIMNDVLNLQYFYTKIYAGITGGLIKDKLSIMVIGGGGYAYPQYVEKRWPGSHIDVVEIDPAVTEAAKQAFGLGRNSSINTITMDARNYVDELLNKQSNGEKIPRYNFIYEDAINDYSVPFQLVTREFNDKIAKILTDDGVYMINLIEIFDSGLFLGAMINTLEKTFPYVHVLVDPITLPTSRQTYVVVAAKHYFEPESILSKYDENLKLRSLSKSDKDYLKEKAGGVVLTDDFAPVENMLAPVVRESAREKLALEYIKQAMYLRERAKRSQSIAQNFVSRVNTRRGCDISRKPSVLTLDFCQPVRTFVLLF
jgi:spermidine synthase